MGAGAGTASKGTTSAISEGAPKQSEIGRGIGHRAAGAGWLLAGFSGLQTGFQLSALT
jgi:hypothetical protein